MKYFVAIVGSLALLCAPIRAAETKPNTIAVLGEAQVQLPPDFATIEVGVITQGPIVADALAGNSEKMSRVVQALRALNVPDKDIQTSNFEISPKYEKRTAGDYDSEMLPIVGYYVSNKAIVTVTDLSLVAKIIDTSVQAGANQGGAVNFGVKNLTARMDDARKAAIADALHKARVLTTAANMRLGPAISVTDNEANNEYNSRAGGRFETVTVTAEKQLATPLLPGELTLTSQLTVVFRTN